MWIGSSGNGVRQNSGIRWLSQVRPLNYAYVHGRLSISQRRGLILFKDDRLQTKNWRPISLLNVDYKIATRAMQGRFLAVIASVVSPDQTCRVPGRTISENMALWRDTIDYAEMENQKISLDQEKVFDRVDWNFHSCFSSMLSPCRRFGICVPFLLCQVGLPSGWTRPSGPFNERANEISLPPCEVRPFLGTVQSWDTPGSCRFPSAFFL